MANHTVWVEENIHLELEGGPTRVRPRYSPSQLRHTGTRPMMTSRGTKVAQETFSPYLSKDGGSQQHSYITQVCVFREFCPGFQSVSYLQSRKITRERERIRTESETRK